MKSLTLKGAIILLLAFLAKTLNVELPYTPDQVTNAIVTLIGVIGFVMTYIGRVRHGDITWYGSPKTK